MLSRRIHFSKVGALLATILVASTVPVAVAAKDKDKDDDKDKAVPFAASAQFSELLLPSTDPKCQPSKDGTTMSGAISGSGLATEIGAFKVESVDCVRSANPYAFTPPFNFSSTSFVLTATNGDQIVVSYSGTAQPSPSGLFALNGEFKFVSGTGEFKKVKGGGTLTGVEDISTNPARGFVTLSGEISNK